MAVPVEPELLEEAVSLAHLAGDLTLQYFRTTDLRIDSKGDGTPVTEADRGAERLLREELSRRHPEDGILGEEEPESKGTSGRRWIIDPIDGTKAFTHGVPTYSNLLALEDADGIALGVIHIPALAETVYAARGLGCFSNGAPVHVNDRDALAGSYMMTSGFSAWPDGAYQAAQHAGLHIRTWGDGYGYALVATGRVEAMYDPAAELYDLAPIPVIIEEAGGRFTDLTGGEGPAAGHGLASNGRFHDELLSLLVGAPGTSVDERRGDPTGE